MVELALASSLIHPDLFGGVLIALAALCGWKIASQQFSKSEFRPGAASPLRVWLLAFGPLFVLSLISVVVHRLNINQVEMWEVMVSGGLLAAGLPLMKTRVQHIGWAAVVASMGALCVVIYSLAITQYHRAGMTFHPINFGIGCGVVLIILLVWLRFRDELFRDAPTLVLGAGIGAALIALLASGSRGPILSFIFCMAAASLLWARHSWHAMGRAGLGLGLLGIVAAMIFYQRVSLELSAGELTSHGIRWELIRITLKQIWEAPILGIGVDQAGKFFAQFPEPIHSLNHAHVTMLNVALELGILGAVAWLWAFGVLAQAFLMQRRFTSAALWQAGLLLTLFIFLCSMTQDILSHTYTRRLLTFALVLFLVMCKENPKDST